MSLPGRSIRRPDSQEPPVNATSPELSRSESSILEPLADQVDKYLGCMLRGRSLPLNLEEAILYTIQGGGKRLRPGLVLLSAEAAGGTAEEALQAAAAMELIHTFSLVHDDLPAMDDDDQRRGRPTLHVQAGEAMAILAADAMVSIAFQTLSEGNTPADRTVALTNELAASTTTMIIGQVHDTLGGFPHELSDEQRLRHTHRAKTGALIKTACRMGGIAAGADERVFDLLTCYGAALGLMFQIVDDILDVTAEAEHLGKATRKDDAKGKLTYPGVLGLDASREEVERLRQLAADAAAALGPDGHQLRGIVDDMAVRTR